MKHENINYLSVGIFVFSMFILLMVVLYKLTGVDTDADVYISYYDNITGITEGSVVSYGGYQIGYVKRIVPVQKDKKTRYKMSLAVKSGWMIPADSVAAILTPGLLSENHVDIHEGTSEKILSPGDEIRGQEEISIMTAMNLVARELEGISEKGLAPLLDNINQHIDKIGSDLSTKIPEMTTNINELLNKLSDGANQLNSILNTKNTKYINNIFRDANQFTAKLAGISERFEDSQATLDKILKNTSLVVTDNQNDIRNSIIALHGALEMVSKNIRSIVYNMESTSRNMSEFSREIRENPGLLLGGKPPADKATQ
jgi:phospholipid/cholesterol/gamma-HCH transport system substrate-binding protein